VPKTQQPNIPNRTPEFTYGSTGSVPKSEQANIPNAMPAIDNRYSNTSVPSNSQPNMPNLTPE